MHVALLKHMSLSRIFTHTHTTRLCIKNGDNDDVAYLFFPGLIPHVL